MPIPKKFDRLSNRVSVNTIVETEYIAGESISDRSIVSISTDGTLMVSDSTSEQSIARIIGMSDGQYVAGEYVNLIMPGQIVIVDNDEVSPGDELWCLNGIMTAYDSIDDELWTRIVGVVVKSGKMFFQLGPVQRKGTD